MDAKDLKTWREENKITQQRLADLLGVKVLAVSRWECGARKVPSFLHLALRELERGLDQKLTPLTRKEVKKNGSQDKRKKVR
jgi:transcriptional regulator with XRE-family HTH domain